MTNAILLAPRPQRRAVVTPQRAALVARIYGFIRAGYNTKQIARLVDWSHANVRTEQTWIADHEHLMADVVRHGATA